MATGNGLRRTSERFDDGSFVTAMRLTACRCNDLMNNFTCSNHRKGKVRSIV